MAAAFLAGPVQAFVSELETPCLIAIQTAFTTGDGFAQLAAQMRLVEIPELADATAGQALDAIVANRLAQHDAGDDARVVLTDETREQLIAFYDETERNLRFTLAALQSAAEYAADMRAHRIAPGHVRAALTDWRSRISA